jgi:plastocyanin
MPQTQMISIDEDRGKGTAVFNPSSLNAAAGDMINWRNNTSSPHWPAPKGKPKDTWMDAEIPGKLPDQPAPTSQQALSFSGATTVEYVCALHPEETGTIVVT